MTRIRIVEQTGSTNADMLALARLGEAREGDWLMAEQQTDGRGRRGRGWISPPGNLYASTVIDLRSNDPFAPTLSFVAGWALWSVARVSCAELKWPNDIMVDNRKLAGILLERSENIIVAGFGLNVLSAPDLPDRKTASVEEWCDDNDLKPRAIFEDLQRSFAANLTKWRAEGFKPFRRLWMSEGPMIGDPLKVDLGNGMTVEGAYSGLAEEGALMLTLASGKVELVHAGEVSPL